MRGGLWAFAIRIFSQVLRLAALVILARLLVPEDFGLLGITLLTVAVLEVFTQTGFQAALVQKKGDVEQFMNTAWTVHAVRGFILYGILYLIAPLIGAFFGTPGVVPLLQVLGITLVLRGLTNVRILYFQKELEFHKEFIYQITASVAQVAVSVSLAVIYRSVWALVLGYLAGDTARLVVSYVLIPRFPRPQLARAHFKEMFTFGKWVFGSSILAFLVTHGDDAFVGKMLGATALGFYQLAYRVSNLPATQITHVISQVTFPAYSKMQDDIPRLREAYLRVLQLTTFFAFPIAGLILVLGGDFTRLFLGEKWLPMVPAMQVLAFWGALRSMAASIGPVYNAIGRPDIGTKLSLAGLVLIAGLIYPFTCHEGILGASLAVLIGALVPSPISYSIFLRITKCPVRRFMKTVLTPAIAATVVGTSLWLLRGLVLIEVSFSTFALLSMLGAFCYVVTMHLLGVNALRLVGRRDFD
jgi:O-antigen/teichoic acid export membrane protein